MRTSLDSKLSRGSIGRFVVLLAGGVDGADAAGRALKVVTGATAVGAGRAKSTSTGTGTGTGSACSAGGRAEATYTETSVSVGQVLKNIWREDGPAPERVESSFKLRASCCRSTGGSCCVVEVTGPAPCWPPAGRTHSSIT